MTEGLRRDDFQGTPDSSERVEAEFGAKRVQEADQGHEAGRNARALAGRVAILVVLLACLAGVGLWANAKDTEDPEAPAAAGEINTVRLDQGNLIYACPPGLVDPLALTADETPVELLIGGAAGVSRQDGGAYTLDVPTDSVLEDPLVPMSAAGVAEGDLASFLLQACTIPSRQQILPAGSTDFGEDTVLILSNPSATPVSARVQVLSPIGAVLDPTQDVLVPAGTTVAVLPAIWAPVESRIGIVVEAEGNGVVAWLQSSGLDGEVPLGTGRLTGQGPSEDVTIVGVNPEAQNTLRVANLSPEPAAVRVSVLSSTGTQVLSGVEALTVEGQGVFDVALGDLPTSTFGLVIEADVPIAAAVREVEEGAPFPQDEDLTVSLRGFIGAANPISGVQVPGLDQLTDAVQGLGLEFVEATLTLANPGTESLTATVGERTVVLEPKTAEQVLVGESAQVVSAGEQAALLAALSVTVDSEAGQIRSVVPLQEEGLGQVEQRVVLTPQH